ncbi:MAG: D-alanyl-D-alanine carboxypeptidase [Clostridiales bacterium]|nr:D-alanyl-D-alanine carboxypeptidase [Clostridiales bacterium]
MKIVKFFLIAVFILNMCASVFAEEPEIKSRSAVLIDADSGRVLWGLDPENPMPMASTTKIMTCIYTIENCDLEDEVVVSKNAASAPKVKLFLSEGERVRLKDLLYALMLRSSNDAAVAIAEHVSGTSEEFCKALTKKAALIGAKDTVFETPNGLDSGNHHSTALDMALITRYALKNETFREIIKTPAYSFSSDKRSYSLTNADRLLTEYSGAIGVKTGYTGKAGHCFVGAAERDGMTLISVVLASGWGAQGKAAKWSDTKAILNYGFDNFHIEEVVKKGDPAGEFEIFKGEKPKGEAVFGESLSLPLKEGEETELKISFDTLNAPAAVGDEVGMCEVSLDGKVIKRIKLLSAEDIEEHSFERFFNDIFNSWLNMCQ